MAKVFFSYSHDDEQYRDQLEKHMALLKREGLIESWHDRRITAGSSIDREIDQHIEHADVVLLLVSASFLASDYCYGIEMRRAMERHAANEATVIPVIVRPCDWKSAPFGKLMAVPRDGKAIVTWANYDEAYTDVARRVREVVEKRTAKRDVWHRDDGGAPPRRAPAPTHTRPLPRSSNMRLRKTFTQADEDNFLHEAFEYMAKFFEGSLQELQARHSDIECRFRRIDANAFTAIIYRAGEREAECAINLGGGFRRGGITYSSNASSRGNSFNEELSVENDDQTLFLKPMGMSLGTPIAKFSVEQGAEHFWQMLIGSLQ
jgi:hypothetical protein